MTIPLREQALQEYTTLTTVDLPNLEFAFSYTDSHLSQLSSDIWQAIGKTTNLCSLLWKLKLEEEAGILQDWKIRLIRMHRELASEIK